MSAPAPSSAAAAAAGVPHTHGSKFKIRVFLDVDNTLYRYEDTKFHNRMHENISAIFSQVFPGMSNEEALTLANKYHNSYGLSLAGIARHHHTPERPFDLEGQCRIANTCDYSVMEKNGAVISMLEAMKDEDGYDLWLFTNADVAHANSCIEGVGIRHLFHEKDGYFKCIDCVDQWGSSPITAITNKPFPEAYACADDKAQGRFTIHEDFVRVMVDDAFANMEAPTKMGWVSVWVAHGREVPADATVQPTIIIQRVEELRGALAELFRKEVVVPTPASPVASPTGAAPAKAL